MGLAHRKIKIEKADGSSSRKEGVGSERPRSGRRAFDRSHPDLRRRSLDTEQKEAWLRQIFEVLTGRHV